MQNLNILPSQIADMTGFSVGSVRNLHVAFFTKGVKIFTLGRAGGRKAAYMTPEEEADFLRQFIETGDVGGHFRGLAAFTKPTAIV